MHIPRGYFKISDRKRKNRINADSQIILCENYLKMGYKVINFAPRLIYQFFQDSEIVEELASFLVSIHSCLKDCLTSFVDDQHIDKLKEQFNISSLASIDSVVFTEYDLTYKCGCYLILAVGRMSVSDFGDTLLEKYGLVEIFKAFLDYSRNDIITKLILGSLDYTRPSLGRGLLTIAIRSDNIVNVLIYRCNMDIH